MERSRAKIRADVVHDRLVALGFEGDERTTRRAVREAKDAWHAGHRRVYRPRIPEPGLWLQWDWAEGPPIGGRRISLFCAWLAWSRYRVVIPTWDRTLPTVVACLDATFRELGGAPTYLLTDNEKPITVEHVAGMAIRHPQIVAAARHDGVTIHTCVPADPETKGGSEATVRVAKADLVPTDACCRLGGHTLVAAAVSPRVVQVAATPVHRAGDAATDQWAADALPDPRRPDGWRYAIIPVPADVSQVEISFTYDDGTVESLDDVVDLTQIGG